MFFGFVSRLWTFVMLISKTSYIKILGREVVGMLCKYISYVCLLHLVSFFALQTCPGGERGNILSKRARTRKLCVKYNTRDSHLKKMVSRMIVVVSKYLKKVKGRIDLRGKCCRTNSTSAIVQIRSFKKVKERTCRI
jgi:hypothetical protein